MKNIKNVVRKLFYACRSALRRIRRGRSRELEKYTVEINTVLVQTQLTAVYITPTVRRIDSAIVPRLGGDRQSGLVYLNSSGVSANELDERLGDMPQTIIRLSRAIEKMRSSFEKSVGAYVKKEFPRLLKDNVSTLEPRFLSERKALREHKALSELCERNVRFSLHRLEYSFEKADSEQLEGFAAAFARVLETKEAQKTLRENELSSPLYTEIRKSGETVRSIGEQLEELRETVAAQEKQLENISLMCSREENTWNSKEKTEEIAEQIERILLQRSRSGRLRNGVF